MRDELFSKGHYRHIHMVIHSAAPMPEFLAYFLAVICGKLWGYVD